MTKSKPLLIGQSDFRQLRLAAAYYVDKSLFIQQVIENSAQVLLLPRPRRFGKTLNLSLLRYFFATEKQDNAALFTGLAIHNTPLFATHQGLYPVIYLTLKDVKSRNWSDCLQIIQANICGAYINHRYLIEGDLLYPEEKSYFKSMLNKKAEKVDYEQSLK